MMNLIYQLPDKKISKPLDNDKLEELYDNSIYERSDIKTKHQINEIKDYINSEKISASILDYNKRKLSQEKYLEYLKLLNMEGLVKYKGKDVKKLFFNIKTSGDYIQIGYDENNQEYFIQMLNNHIKLDEKELQNQIKKQLDKLQDLYIMGDIDQEEYQVMKKKIIIQKNDIEKNDIEQYSFRNRNIFIDSRYDIEIKLGKKEYIFNYKEELIK